MPARNSPAKSPTIRDVAIAASVSPSTVSRVFTRPELISDATVARVMTIAAQMGYAPNLHARSLSTGRKDTVALLVPDIANPFFPPLIKAVERYFQERQVAVLLAETDEEPDLEAQLTSTLRGRADGLIISSPRGETADLIKLAGSMPLVLVNREHASANRVLIDSSQGIHDAVLHLVELGHRRLAYLEGPQRSWSNEQRRTVFLKTAEQHGVQTVVIASEKPNYESGVKVVDELLASKVTGLVAYDDVLAQGVLAGLRDRGLSVPDDLSIIGCDDLVAPVTVPPMTSIRVSVSQAGEMAARQLQTLMARGKSKRREEVLVDRIPSSLCVRASTAPPRAGLESGSPA